MQRVAGQIAAASDPTSNTDVLDLSSAMLSLMDGQNAFAANVKAVQSQDELQKSLLNLFG